MPLARIGISMSIVIGPGTIESLRIKNGDLILIRTPKPISARVVDEFRREFAAHGYPNCLLINLAPGADLTNLDEAMMAKLGWVRKP